jgi:hypothetical protein
LEDNPDKYKIKEVRDKAVIKGNCDTWLSGKGGY